MESNRKQRGFKAKLTTSLYQAPKSAPVQVTTVKPHPPPTTASMTFGSGDELSLKQKAFSAKQEGIGLPSVNETGNAREVAGDDCVDKRAAAYISYVQDRLKREHGDYEIRKYY